MANQQPAQVQKTAIQKYQEFEKRITSDDVKNQLIVALDLKPQDEDAQREAFKFAQSVLMEVKRTQGAEYGDLTKATVDSIVMCMIDAATLRVSIDGRKMAFMEVRSGVAALQITTNGFVAKIKERYPDLTHSVMAIFESDTFNIRGSEGAKSYDYESKNPFNDLTKLKGIGIFLSYTGHGGQKISDVHTVTKSELDSMAARGKGKAWQTDALERRKTAALKRACKWHFRQDATLQKVIDYDNEHDTDFSIQPAAEVRPGIISNINRSIEGQKTPPEGEITHQEEAKAETVTDGAPKPDVPPEVNKEALLKAGEDAAGKGDSGKAYKAWKESLTEEEKDAIRDHHPGWWEKVKSSTAAAFEVANKDEPPM